MRPKHPLIITITLLAAVLAIAKIDSQVLSQRTEKLDFVEASECQSSERVTLATADEKRESEFMFFVCGGEEAIHDSKKQTMHFPSPMPADAPELIKQMGDQEITGDAFYLDSSVTERLKCKYGDHNYCHNASTLERAMGAYPEFFHPDDKDSELTLDSGEFVIRLAEKKEGHGVSTALLLSALTLLVGGLVYAWRRRETFPRPAYKVYDGVSAFVASLVVGVVLSAVGFKLAPYTGLYIPQTTMTYANFGMFFGIFGTATIYIVYRLLVGADKTKLQAENEGVETEKQAACVEEKEQLKASEAVQPASLLKMHPMAFAPCAGFVLAILAGIFAYFAGSYELDLNDVANQFTGQQLALCHFAMLAGISEELLYRGVIQTAIGGRETHGKRAVAGMFIAAILFMSVHIPQSTGHLFTLIPVFCLGLTSGYARMKTQSIFPSMTMHLTYNTSLLIPALFV